jgi:hypothetical protein
LHFDEFWYGMTLMSVRLLSVIALGLAVAGCQTSDGSKLGSVSGASDSAAAVQVTSATTNHAQKKSGRYYIEFRSRYALTYGHTFVMFGRLDKAGRIVDREVAGLHPATNSVVPYVLGHYIPVPAETGESDGDTDDKYRSASWRVTLNEAEYNKVVAYIRKLQARSRFWQATTFNCNAFVGDIARSMGYKAPGHLLRPQQYIVKLREMNGGPNAVGYTGPPG